MTNRVGAMSRDDATRRVMKAIVLRSPQVKLPFRAEDGSQPLIVALPYENISEVVGRLVSIGGHANVAVAFADKFYLVVIDSNGKISSGPIMEINQDISMGMFLIKLSQHPNTRVHFHFKNIEAGAPSLQQELSYA